MPGSLRRKTQKQNRKRPLRMAARKEPQTSRPQRKPAKKTARPGPKSPASRASPAPRKTKFLRVARIIERLEAAYPDAKCALDHENPLQLLIATILSAQSTDKMVNIITPALFRKYRTAEAFANADTAELESMIHSSGFFRNKARSIKAASRVIADEHHGKVPDSMEDLIKLSGVARKTANGVLGVAFGQAEGVGVDTHVQRLSRRLGFFQEERPRKIGQDLVQLFPRDRVVPAADFFV